MFFPKNEFQILSQSNCFQELKIMKRSPVAIFFEGQNLELAFRENMW